jgi:hypothetical protein
MPPAPAVAPRPGATRTAPASTGSSTVTIAAAAAEGGAPPTLVLRGAPAPPAQRVSWAQDVVDNEGQKRKSSKGPSAPAPAPLVLSPAFPTIPLFVEHGG